MKCEECGADNPEEAKFCRKCGAKLSGEKEEEKEKKDIDEKFPLIKLEKNGREVTFAWGHIHWDPSLSSLIYEVHEPRLTRKEEEIFNEISNVLKEKLEIPFTKIKSEEAYDFLVKKFRSTIDELGYSLTWRQMLKLEYYVYRDFIGLGKIEPIMHDPEIEDVSCDGVDIPIFVYHRNPLLGEVQTNITFNSAEELSSFVLRLAQKCGKSISVAQPLLDGSLPDGSRVQATYGTDIARRGSNFTIRKFTENPFSPIDEMDFGTINAEILAYLWLAIENQLSVLCSGGTATGKCVSPDTKIQLANGERKEAKKIFEEHGGKGQGWTKPKRKLKVLSLDPKDLKIKEKRVSKLWKLEGKEMLSFKLNNSQIEVTPEHPFFTIREGELRRVRADELEEGERVAIAKRIPVKSKARVSIPNADGAGIGNSNSDIFLDEIQEIKNTGKKDWVYDLTVPGTHNFLAGEGVPLVISNTAMLNALSLFIKPEMKVVSIEDSVSGDTSFQYINDEALHFGKVGDYIDRAIEDRGYKVNSGHEVAENINGLEVPTIDQEGRVKYSGVSALIRHKVNKDMYEVKTRAGSEVEVTKDHSLYIIGPDPDKMGAGKFLRSLLENRAKIEAPYDSDFKIEAQGGEIEDSYIEVEKEKIKSRKKSIKNGFELDEDWMYLLGYFTTRASVRNKMLSFPEKEKPSKILKQKAQELGFEVVKRKGFSSKIRSSPFCHLVRDVLGLGLEADYIEDRTPAWVLSTPRSFKKAFIEGYKEGNDQPLYKIKPKLCRAKVSKLEEGDRIVSPRKLPSRPSDISKFSDLGMERFSDKEVSKKFLEFLGLWVAYGCFDHNTKTVMISAPNKEVQPLFNWISNEFGLSKGDHSEGFSTNFYSKEFYQFMRELGLEHSSGSREVPEFIFSLDEEKVAAFLRGYFAGDNDDGAYGVGAFSKSKKLIHQIKTLLLRFGIRGRISKKEKGYRLRVSSQGELRRLGEKVGFIREDRKTRYEEIIDKEKTDHNCSDVFELPKNFLWSIIDESKNLVGKEWTYKTWKSLKSRYRKSNPGRKFLEKVLEKGELSKDLREALEFILNLSTEEIKEIKDLEKREKYVYDFSVPPEERFIANGLLCSNTPELRLPHANWVPEVARTGFGMEGGGSEVTMFDLLKASLRKRPDYIIVGEVRGKEANVMFQGMASIRGNEKVTIITPEGNTKRIKIEKLMEKDLKGCKTLTIDPKTKEVKLKPIKACVKHRPRKELYKIKTKTGREVTVTGDHSVFISRNGRIKEKEVSKLKEDESIIISAKAPCGYSNIDYLNLAKELEGIRVKAPEYIKAAMEELSWKEAGVSTISDYYGDSPSALKSPAYYSLLEEAGIENSPSEIRVKSDRRSEERSARLEITSELLRFIGYYLSDGSLNTAPKNNTIQFYNNDEDVLEDMERCIEAVVGKKPNERKTSGFGESTELSVSHKVIYEFLKQFCNHGAEEKKIPEFIYGLSKERISEFLSALWTGDGTCLRDCFQYNTKSEELAEGVMQLLLCYGIVAHKYWKEDKGVYQIEFYNRDEQGRFQESIHPINKNVDLKREKRPSQRFEKEVYRDPIESIERLELEEPEPVYDLNVPGTQNFIGGSGGIMLHNTGHPGLGTIHADSFPAVIDRLTTRPINLPRAMLENLDIVVFMTLTKSGEEYIRRVETVVEILEYSYQNQEIKTNDVFEWTPKNDEFRGKGSVLLERLREKMGYTAEEIEKDLRERVKILKWLGENDISNYEKFSKYIRMYYYNKSRLLEIVEEE